MATLDAQSISTTFDSESNKTSIQVVYIYKGTQTGAAAGLSAIKAVPATPPGLKGEKFQLNQISADQNDEVRSLFTVTAVYDNATFSLEEKIQQAEGNTAGGASSWAPPNSDLGGGETEPFDEVDAEDFDGLGDVGVPVPCTPPPTESTTTIRAMKDYPIKNACGTPILPSPQIEVHMIQRTVTEYRQSSDPNSATSPEVAQAQNELNSGAGKIDPDETQRQNDRRGIDLTDTSDGGRCAEEEGAPAPGGDEFERSLNAPCGSLMTGGTVGAMQKGPCGAFFAVTKTFIDGNFRAPGIANVGYKKCNQSSGSDMHVGTLDGQRYPIVALESIPGEVIAWPGQPKVKK
jgi:hypothetical protein